MKLRPGKIEEPKFCSRGFSDFPLLLPTNKNLIKIVRQTSPSEKKCVRYPFEIYFKKPFWNMPVLVFFKSSFFNFSDNPQNKRFWPSFEVIDIRGSAFTKVFFLSILRFNKLAKL